MRIPIFIQTPVDLPRYFWHPSVVYVEKGFGGHKWWMAQTPFPPCHVEPYRDRYELPCIHFSDDGITWQSIENNPIEGLTLQQIEEMDYYSDPHIIYKDGSLELYYRFTVLRDKQPNDFDTIIYKRVSNDGKSWSQRKIIADLRTTEDKSVWGEQIISPAVVWNGKEYLCWYVDVPMYVGDRRIRVTSSKDGIKWNTCDICTLDNTEIVPWHLDVQFFDDIYRLVLYSDKQNNILYYESLDGMNYIYKQVLLSLPHTPFLFYSSELYRACMVDGPNHVKSLFFSGANYLSKRSYIGRIDSNDMVQWIFRGRISLPFIIDTAYMIYKKFRKMIKKLLYRK